MNSCRSKKSSACPENARGAVADHRLVCAAHQPHARKEAQKVGWTLACTAPGEPRRPYAYQYAAGAIFHPKVDPNIRLACLIGTGGGKTVMMCLMLDNFFADPRPKVLIFPSEEIRRNFYWELASTPNKYYKLYYEKTRMGVPHSPTADQKKEFIEHFQEWLKKPKHRLHVEGKHGEELFAPLRTFTYVTAMGSSAREEVKRMKRHAESRIYDDCIMLLDEARDLFPSHEDKDKKQKQLRAALRTELETRAHNTAIGFYTATPENFREFMRIVRGAKFKPRPGASPRL